MQLTPETLGNSLVVLFVTYFIVLAFQLYMMYLNWKQSRVNNQMDELIKEVRSIKSLLKKK
jgi:hypothetical protein